MAYPAITAMLVLLAAFDRSLANAEAAKMKQKITPSFNPLPRTKERIMIGQSKRKQKIKLRMIVSARRTPDSE